MKFITSGVKAGPLCCSTLSVMYSHSQRGICSVAPLTLPSRALSRACVYLPLFVLTSPRPRRENTSRGGGKGSHAAQHRQPAPSHTTTSPRCPKSQGVGSEWPQTAPLQHPVTFEEPLFGPEVFSVVERCTRDDTALAFTRVSRNTLVRGPL